MRSYDPPDDPCDLTAEQAQRALNKMHADALSDKEHPYLNGNHPQNGDFSDYARRLHTIIATAESEEQDALEAEKFAAALEETGDLTPAECLARGRELLKTKGYLDGSLPQEERAALRKEIDAFFLVGCQEPEPPEDEEISDDL
ncbi:MAG: hypothetical protein NTY65_03545 [Planctomycetota bacterium]|nr:hypothetical protein [Planctomycetota bacterium]